MFSQRSPLLDLPIASHPGNLPNSNNDPEPSVPGLMQEGAEALLVRAVRTKEEPLVDPVLIQEVISPYIVRVLRPSGLEETVSSRRIAPYPKATETIPVVLLPHCTAEETKAPQSVVELPRCTAEETKAPQSVVVFPRCTAEETKAPQSVDVQDQPMSPETLSLEAASPS